MDVTTMPTTDSLLSKLIRRYPHLSFREGEDFFWSPGENTVYYTTNNSLFNARLLHEVSHAELGHTSYTRDIELIAIEREAWKYAKTTLAPLFDLTIESSIIEDDLDTYRDWLHARSTCPNCQHSGVQTDNKQYTCVVCRNSWSVNTATTCGLKRYKQNTPL